MIMWKPNARQTVKFTTANRQHKQVTNDDLNEINEDMKATLCTAIMAMQESNHFEEEMIYLNQPDLHIIATGRNLQQERAKRTKEEIQ